MSELFKKANHAELYAKYRPIYPTEVVTKIIQYACNNKSEGTLSHMVDVGCGSGQSTEIYAPYVKKITAIDISASQIEQAKISSKNDNIKYVIAQAEEIPADDNSVDLLCSGLAIHWCDFSKFWPECKRVLKPDGSVVLYGYGFPHVIPDGVSDTSDEFDDLEQHAWSLTMELLRACKFHENVKHVVDKYAEIFKMLPFEEKYRDDSIKAERHCSLSDFGKCVSTWSGYQTYLSERKCDDEDPNILMNYLNKLKILFQREESDMADIKVVVSWDVFMLFARRPQ